MAKKQWYCVEVECIRETPELTMRKGEKQIVAKVNSLGLAYVTANAIDKLYSGKCYVIVK